MQILTRLCLCLCLSVRARACRVEDLKAAAKKQLPPSVSLRDIGECLVAMHGEMDGQRGGNMLGVLHSMGYTRGLLNTLGFPESARLQSLVWYARVGLLPPEEQQKALTSGEGALRVWDRAVLAYSWVGVSALRLFIHVLLHLGPFLFLVEWMRFCVLMFWRCCMNILAWPTKRNKED